MSLEGGEDVGYYFLDNISEVGKNVASLISLRAKIGKYPKAKLTLCHQGKDF